MTQNYNKVKYNNIFYLLQQIHVCLTFRLCPDRQDPKLFLEYLKVVLNPLKRLLPEIYDKYTRFKEKYVQSTLFPGIKPFRGCRDSNNFSYLSLSANLIVQSTAAGGRDVISGEFVGGGGFTGFGSGISPLNKKLLKHCK